MRTSTLADHAASPLSQAKPCRERQEVSPASRYERLESNIGEGAYGKVHKAKDTRDGSVVAIKRAKVAAMEREVAGIGFTALREIKLMQAVKHANLVSCLDVFADGGVINLVMEFMDSDLSRLIEDKSICLSEAHVKCLFQQLLQGLSALHEQWFVHRDVTPQNVLLSFGTGAAKLCDFGFSRTVGHNDRPLTPMCTTLWYRAPELLYGARYYGHAVDLWGAGCVAAEMFLRHALFPGRGEFDMLGKIFEKRGTPTEETWPDVSALPTFVEFSDHPKEAISRVLPTASTATAELVDKLLSLDPRERSSARGALAHECFTTAAPQACGPAQLPFVC